MGRKKMHETPSAEAPGNETETAEPGVESLPSAPMEDDEPAAAQAAPVALPKDAPLPDAPVYRAKYPVRGERFGRRGVVYNAGDVVPELDEKATTQERFNFNLCTYRGRNA